ncbi:MAG: c-type cytochrome [Burkholderiaceae bacterium]|jgi:cytochrome c553
MKSDTNFFVRSVRLGLMASLVAAPIAIHAAAPASGPSVAPAGPKVDLQKGASIAGQVCVGCHAVDGNSTVPDFPILAGQHAAYLSKQLHNFQVKPNAKKAERENAVMAGFAAALSEDDIRNVSAFYASQAIKPSYAQKKDVLTLGQTIYRAGVPARGIPACVGCHAPNGAGIPAQYPRLSGQYAQYTKSQLAAFKSGARANSAQMNKISAQLTDQEMEALAEYIAGLR